MSVQEEIPTERILVVDDESISRSLAHIMLTRHRYCVAANWKEALKVFDECPDFRVDLLLCEMTSVEMAERVRALRPNLPVLYTSAYSDEKTLRPVLSTGVSYVRR